MCILAIDTASNICAACVFDPIKNEVLAKQSDDIGRGHAEHLLGLIDILMDQSGQSFASIEKISVSVGPGSFTGIRVGVAAARGFGLALNKSVVGVSVFQAMAAAYNSQSTFAVALQGGRGQAFVQGFNKNTVPIKAPYIVNLKDDLKGAVGSEFKAIIGNAAEQIDKTRAVAFIDSATAPIEHFAMLAIKSEMAPSPLYIRSADAKIAEGYALPRQVENNK